MVAADEPVPTMLPVKLQNLTLLAQREIAEPIVTNVNRRQWSAKPRFFDPEQLPIDVQIGMCVPYDDGGDPRSHERSFVIFALRHAAVRHLQPERFP